MKQERALKNVHNHFQVVLEFDTAFLFLTAHVQISTRFIFYENILYCVQQNEA